MSRWDFEVIQDGLRVAAGSCPDENTARREAMHYSMMYAEDGAVKTVVKEEKQERMK